MVVHPICDHWDNTVANGIAWLLRSDNNHSMVRPVNRLDKDTSGVIVFAMNSYVQEHLILQMQSGLFKKEYLAVIPGKLNPSSGTVSAPISRTFNSIMLREVSEDGARAVTHYQTENVLGELSLIRLQLETGRTHQIRVHLKYLGNPVLGDPLYGTVAADPRFKKGTLMLHAKRLSLVLPENSSHTVFNTKLPERFREMIKVL